MVPLFLKKITFRDFCNEHSTGVYGTVLIHLAIFIILLSAKLYSVGTRELTILLDLSEPDVKTTVPHKDNQREKILKDLNQRIATASSNITVRNVSVNVADRQDKPLPDDRKTDAAKLYGDAQKLQAELDAARQKVLDQQGADDVVKPAKQTEEKTVAPYQGASVVRYDLGGRASMSLPVPAYQCQNGGDIKVLIEVDRRGYVKKVRIDDVASSGDRCIQEAAQAMARLSRFEVDGKAPERQSGYILYRFIPQ